MTDYDFELSASGYLLAFEPSVVIRVRMGEVESLKTSDGKEAATRRNYERFGTVERIFKFLNEIEAKNPDKLSITYSETGYPAYVELDERKGMSDDELTLRVTNLQNRD